MVYELYQTLEVSPQAELEEIRRSYYRLVRKYSPERHPERFQVIREAYETLSDKQARQNYDALQKYGDEIQVLIEQAETCMSEEQWAMAIDLLKRILTLAPGADAARNRLGICYIHSKNWDFAVKVFRALTKINPNIPLYWLNFGYAYKQQADLLDREDYRRGQLYYQARECFQVCTKIESFNPEPYVEIARTYLEESNYTESLAWAERAIGADGKTDFQDFDTLFFICIIYWRSGEFAHIDRTAQRIISLLPANNDARKYAAARFFNMGLDIFKFGVKQVNYSLFKAASKFLRAAKDFDPNDIEIEDLYQNVDLIVAAVDGLESLRQDSTIVNELKSLCEFILADRCYYFESDDEKNKIYDRLMEEIFANPPNLILDSVNKIKSSYLAIYQLNSELFGQIEQAIYQWYTQQSAGNYKSFSGIGKEITSTLKKWLKWR